MLLTTGCSCSYTVCKAVVPTTCFFVMLFSNETMILRNTKSFNYIGTDLIYDHSWLTMLLGNVPLVRKYKMILFLPKLL